MPNPSEMQRAWDEQCEQRSQQYRELEQARNRMTGLCKKDKEATLKRIRALEASLGLPSRNYNGGF